VRLSGHDDRPVAIVERDGRAMVAKRYLRSDGARVFQDHVALWRSPFGGERDVPGIPEPYGWDAERRELRMELVHGDALAVRGALGETDAQCDVVAALLADLHESAASAHRTRAARHIVRSLRRKHTDLAVADAAVAPRFGAVVDRLAQCAARLPAEVLVPVHGDFSPRNVLATTAGPRLIDLDRLSRAGAARDVAYWAAWAWTTAALAGDTTDPWSVGRRFGHAYLTRRPHAADELALTLSFHTAAALLRIAHGWTVLQAAPASQRLVVSAAAALAHGAAADHEPAPRRAGPGS